MRKLFNNTAIYLLPLLIYIGISSLFFGLGVLNHINSVRLGTSNDSVSFIWSFSWWLHALHHGLNPFFTDSVWYPYRYNLAQQDVIMLGNFLLVAPIAFLFGPLVAYNITEIFASALAAWTAFILCRYITQSFWPALFGGYFFGYSSYMIGHVLGHPILITVFPLPLIILCCLKFYRYEISATKFLIFLVPLLAFQFITSLETITPFIVFSFLTLLLTLLVEDSKNRVWRLFKYIFVGGILTLIVVSPYLYLFFSTPLPTNGFPNAIYAPSDLLSFIVPSFLMLVNNNFTYSVTQHFIGNAADWNTYLGIPLIILLLFFAVEFWKQSTGKLLILCICMTIMASLGYSLYILGKPIFPLPWHFLGYIPLWNHALPMRFGIFISLILAMITAYWLAYTRRSLYIKALLLCGSILFLMPTFNRSDYPWANPMTVPTFISQKDYTQWLKPNDVVLILPYAELGPAMNWQMQSHFYFKMAGGYLGYAPQEFAGDPTVGLLKSLSQNANLNIKVNPEMLNDLKSFLVNHKVSAILVANNFATWENFFASLNIKPIHQGDIDLYNLKPIMEQLQTDIKQHLNISFQSWYDPEFGTTGYSRWSAGNSIITVTTTKPVFAEITTDLYTIDPRQVKLYVNQHLIKIFDVVNFSPINHFQLPLKQGKNIIQWVSTKHAKQVANDPRELSFALRNFTIQVAN